MRNSNFFEYKNHYFVNKSNKYITGDFVCDKCKIRINVSLKNEILIVLNYIQDLYPGFRGPIYDLSCEEEIIKNILE